MARPERSNDRRNRRNSNSVRRDTREGRRFDSRRSGGRRDSGRDFRSRGRDRREVTMTKVICSSCGQECEVPFKPTSDKPVYCNDCFAKKGGSGKRSNKDFEIINEKLDKIMEALKIK